MGDAAYSTLTLTLTLATSLAETRAIAALAVTGSISEGGGSACSSGSSTSVTKSSERGEVSEGRPASSGPLHSVHAHHWRLQGPHTQMSSPSATPLWHTSQVPPAHLVMVRVRVRVSVRVRLSVSVRARVRVARAPGGDRLQRVPSSTQRHAHLGTLRRTWLELGVGVRVGVGLGLGLGLGSGSGSGSGLGSGAIVGAHLERAREARVPLRAALQRRLG